ncbi:MAG: hypothetical protein J7L39_04320 [Candidatus Aenigmarchaeota archaeon]|nr:hypothetical protein [Candidatus Aenigmarchaeota archaeon]
METIITHADSDGIISAAIFLKATKLRKFKVLFTSTPKVKDTICRSIIGNNELRKINIFDISPTELLLTLSSVYQKVLWIDHHKMHEIPFIPKNVELVVNDSKPSAAQVVADYFKIKNELVDIANEIDTNQVKSDEARFLRDYIGAIKWKFRGKFVQSKLKNALIVLVREGIGKLGNDESTARLIEEYRKWCEESVKDTEKKLLVEEVNGHRVAIIETTSILPIFLVCEKLKMHEKAPFDIIALINHRVFRNKIISKIELRTHTGFKLYNLAKKFGGGGHEKACGATIEDLFTASDLLRTLESFLTSS